MEQITTTLRGIATEVSTIYANRRVYYTFTLSCEEQGTYKVYVRHEDTEWEIEDGEHYTASGFAVADGSFIATSVDRWGRKCDVCGGWMIEGYWVGECHYACTEDCALHFYGGDRQAFEDDLALLENPDTADDADTYWTEWK